MKRTIKKIKNEASLGTIKLLARNAVRLRSFLAALPIPYLRISQTGDVLDMHMPTDMNFAFSREDIIGQPLTEVYPSETALLLQQKIGEALQSGEMQTLEQRIPMDGKMHRFNLRIIPATHDEVMVLLHEILDPHSLEEDILRAHQIDSIGLVAGSIAHDFNNVLMAILGNIQYAAAELARMDLPDISESLSDAEAACLRANEVTRKLTSFTNDANPDLKKTDLGSIIRETAALSVRGTDCQLRVESDPDLWPAIADSAQISRVLHNLVQNAVQASPNGGLITVSMNNVDLDKPGNDTTPLPLGRYIRISIEDQGRGIPAAQLAKIFLPQFNPGAQRIGLGLPICFSIIKHHKGRIEAESKLGKGSTFHIYLPAAVSTPAQTDASSVPLIRREASDSRGHILLMDDDHSLRKIMQRTLSKDGYRTDEAADGDEAITLYERARAKNDPYDLVILDLYIPGGMGGAETLTALRAINPRIKAIMSTGCVDKKVIQSCADLGFNAIITKPYRRETLNEVLRAVIENRPIPSTSN